MMRFIPSKAKITAFVLALFYAVFWWLRHDAKQDGKMQNEIDNIKQDQQNAQKISTDVAHSRRNDDGLHTYKDHGYRE